MNILSKAIVAPRGMETVLMTGLPLIKFETFARGPPEELQTTKNSLLFYGGKLKLTLLMVFKKLSMNHLVVFSLL